MGWRFARALEGGAVNTLAACRRRGGHCHGHETGQEGREEPALRPSGSADQKTK
jgi:hypothetical protein